MGKIGAGSLASGVLRAVAVKILASQAGPAAVALLGSLEQTRQTALGPATLNGQTALVQGASALEGSERREYLRTAALLVAAATLASVVALAAAPARVARFAGLPEGMESLVVRLALPLALSSAFVFLSALLAALGAVGELAWLKIAASLAMAAAAWPAATALGHGSPPALVHLLSFSAAVSVAAALGMLARYRATLSEWFRGPVRLWTMRAARRFLSISGAMLATGVVSSAALLVVRARIVHTAGLAEAGQFDAAWSISMNHVTVVLGAVQVYCLPQLAGAGTTARQTEHLRGALAVTAAVVAPGIALLAALKPLALTVFYSGAFHPAALYLRWTLLGDYLKCTSWILSLAILARAEMRAFLATDLAAYGVFVAGSWMLARWFSAAESAAMAFVLMYATHLCLCYAWLHWRHSFTFGAKTAAIWMAGLALVAVSSAAAWNP